MTILNIWEKNFMVSIRAEGRVKVQCDWQSKPVMRGRIKEKSLTKRDGQGQRTRDQHSQISELHKIMLGEGKWKSSPKKGEA